MNAPFFQATSSDILVNSTDRLVGSDLELRKSSTGGCAARVRISLPLFEQKNTMKIQEIVHVGIGSMMHDPRAALAIDSKSNLQPNLTFD